MLAVYVSTRIDTKGFMTFIVRTNSILACDSGAIRNLTQVFWGTRPLLPSFIHPCPRSHSVRRPLPDCVICDLPTPTHFQAGCLGSIPGKFLNVYIAVGGF